ncbi:early endosome antigen 1 isoform X2 [Amia ocellicauda]|uniref:early endosome antigen 1 isoform X2 n=1 Tax=Amia ocellicauda TaxID=2972642 RepID=UPI003464410C
MSAKDNPCRKFQANIFNKSKCQNCFKPRESHLLNDEDLNQAKPIYGGWLLLVPEGTDFDNPVHRTRKWQRRFFILYEHGLLRFALDEMPSTLPQGTINMNQCSDVIDGEARTGQKNSLCILTPEREHFIRAENKETINGWYETLIVYPRTNKQNLKKKRKVEPPTPQEPGPAKVAVTSSSSIASVEKVPTCKSTLWQEERRARGGIPCSRSASCLSQLSQANHSQSSTSSTAKEEQAVVNGGRKARVESGYFSLEKTKPDPPPLQQLPLATSSSPGGPDRYSSPDTDPLTSPPCRSPDCGGGDPFLSPGPLYSNGSSAISSSQSSLDSEVSSTTQTSGASCEGHRGGGVAGGGGSERAGRMGRSASDYACLADVPKAKRISHRDAFRAEKKRQEQRSRTRSPGREEVARLFGQERRRSQVIEKFETVDSENAEHMETSSSSEQPALAASVARQGRSERRHCPKKQEFSLDNSSERSMPDVSTSTISPYRRAKSLDRRATESSMTPDLLNFKKGWMTKLYEDGLWKKHWFVLTDQSLRYYRDSIAEEAADLDGEIDLSTCYDVTEFAVQRNYGFQILTKEGAFTLSAMTSGIRRNWIQAVMKNVRPTTAPDVTSSLPEEKAKAAFVSSQAPAETPESSAGTEAEGSSSEQRRSRVRERRREGRSKTFDWSEFRPAQEKGDEEGDAASSPSPPSSASNAALQDPGDAGELERERARRREERRRRFETVDGSSEDSSRMEVDRSPVSSSVSPASSSVSPVSPLSSISPPTPEDGKGPDVHVEIEQRWHQVETTPLREEKQVPIATLHTSEPGADRLPPQELAALLDRELEQTQKELAKLQEQNSLLQDQLKEARGRELSAREGYVLQNDSSASPTGAWQRLHKLNQDLQNELESQSQRQDLTNQQVQALKRNYSEAKDVIRHHESEIQSLQTKLNNAMAEILISEQAVAKMRSELKMEQEKFKERMEEWEHNEQTLRTQLKDSEDRLKDVEALLLEKSQAFRDLERQQALQRDYLKEVQRLQDRLAEVTNQLITTEQTQTLKEERFQRNYEMLKESQEKEKESLTRRLVEAEGKVRELEDRLQEAEQQVEDLLKEKRATGLESSEVVHQLEEQLAIRTSTIQKLTENIRELEEEKDQLTCRCQELINQITEADNEVAKLQSRLKTEETDYYNLEHSYEKVSEQFQKINKVLREKEEEIREAKEMYERLVEKKEQDLNEALVKMAALGSSLEETEMKLQTKEELLSKMSHDEMELDDAGKDIQAKLEVAEDRITELQQHLNDLQLGYADLQMENGKLQEDCDVLESMRKGEASSAAVGESPQTDVRPKVKSNTDMGASLAKRQRIRFSSIHCQKYVHPDGTEKLWASSTSSDTSQDRSLSEESGSSDPPYHYITSTSSDPEKFISIIHSLETKLYVTEEKLKEITLKLEAQQGRQLESMIERHSQWAKTETELQGQLSESLSKVDKLTTQLQEEMDKRNTFAQETSCCIKAVNTKYEKALACVESSREKVHSIIKSHKEDSADLKLHTLSEIETQLVNATIYIRQGGSSLVEQQLKYQETPNRELSESEMTDEDRIKLFAKTLAFEALVLNKMAFSIQNPNFDLLQGLSAVHQEAEKLKRSDESYVAIVYADVLTQKLMLESEFWAEVEKLKTQFEEREGGSQGAESTEKDLAGEAVIKTACVKAELAFAVQNVKHFYEQKLQKVKEDLLEAHKNLQQRDRTLKEIVKAYKMPDFDRVIQEVTDEFSAEQGRTLADISPPELAPYVEQIKMEEAHHLAEQIIDRHLQTDLPSCSIDAVDSPHIGRDKLAEELKRQAEILHHLSQEIEATCDAEDSDVPHRLIDISRVRPCYTHPSNMDNSSLFMREAMVQAQIAYVACKLRADHEKDLQQCRDACQSMDILCQEHARNVNAIRDRYESSLQEERQSFSQAVSGLKEENESLRGEVSRHMSELSLQQERLQQTEQRFRQEMEELKQRYQQELQQAEEKRAAAEMAMKDKTAESQRKLETILLDIENMEDRHEEHVQKLEDKFHCKIQELQRIHEEEMQRLHGHYTQTIKAMQETLEALRSRHPEDPPVESSTPPQDSWPMEEADGTQSPVRRMELDSMTVLKDRIQELETQMNVMRDELEHKHLEGDVSSLKEKYQKDFENLKATCERGFTAMEETHQKVIEDIQRQHQREVCKLLEERERLLAEETAATIAAIEAMKNAHREELEKNQRSQISGMSSDIDELRRQYDEELRSIYRELEVLSEQYSQKCLENAHLAQALEAERQALRQCQRENQELNAHNQELNNRLASEITRLRSCITGQDATSPLTHGKDIYELEVLLRVKESEIQYLKQEIHSLKDELQSALRDKKYATDKYKDIYTELSIVKAKADCDITKLKEQLLAATEALGQKTADSTAVSGYDIMKSKSNPDFLKKERSTISRQIRGVRSKSVIEQVSWDS